MEAMAKTDPRLCDNETLSAALRIHAGGAGTDKPGGGSKDTDKDDDDAQVGIATKTRTKPKKPSQYKVLLLNDDYTPMEFVVMVLTADAVVRMGMVVR